MFSLEVEEAFEAAHQIQGYPGKCARLHGHNWLVKAKLTGNQLNHLGMLVDFKEAKAALKEVLSQYDHRFLNEIPPFSEGTTPTAEHLAQEIFSRLATHKIFSNGVSLSAITVWETPKSSVTYSEEK